jgi:hypothetical protein
MCTYVVHVSFEGIKVETRIFSDSVWEHVCSGLELHKSADLRVTEYIMEFTKRIPLFNFLFNRDIDGKFCQPVLVDDLKKIKFHVTETKWTQVWFRNVYLGGLFTGLWSHKDEY